MAVAIVAAVLGALALRSSDGPERTATTTSAPPPKMDSADFAEERARILAALKADAEFRAEQARITEQMRLVHEARNPR